MYSAVEAMFGALGCPLEDRLRCADTLSCADLRGIDSHGVSNVMPSYVEMLKNGFVNSAPKIRVGLNPIGIAVPTRQQPPFIFGASISAIAGNKIRIARRLGSSVLPGWIAAADSTAIMEESPVPDEPMMLPLGGTREIGSHGGYGLSVMMGILSGLLGGDPAGFERVRGGVSHHSLAYWIDAFTDLESFKNRMDVY